MHHDIPFPCEWAITSNKFVTQQQVNNSQFSGFNDIVYAQSNSCDWKRAHIAQVCQKSHWRNSEGAGDPPSTDWREKSNSDKHANKQTQDL